MPLAKDTSAALFYPSQLGVGLNSERENFFALGLAERHRPEEVYTKQPVQEEDEVENFLLLSRKLNETLIPSKPAVDSESIKGNSFRIILPGVQIKCHTVPDWVTAPNSVPDSVPDSVHAATCIKETEVHTKNLFLSYLTNLVYIAFLSAQKQIKSWSQGIQKNGKYKVTTAVTNEEIPNFSVPRGIHHLPSYYSFLFDTSSVYSLSFGPKAKSILITRDSEKWEI